MLYYLRRAKGVFWGASEIARQRNFATQVQFTSLTKGTSKIPLVSRKEVLGQRDKRPQKKPLKVTFGLFSQSTENVVKVHFILVSSFIQMKLKINGSFDVKKLNTHQTFKIIISSVVCK